MAGEKSRLVLLKNAAKGGGQEKIPVIIVPGMAILWGGENWKKILEKNGHTTRIADLYTILATQTIDEQARRLFSEIEKILFRLKAEKCHLLAFSMGGVTALHFLKNYNYHNRVLKCICAASPFDGIPGYFDILAPFKILIRGLPEIMRGNKLLAEISKEEDAPPIQFFTVRGSADLLCAKESCCLPFANNLPPTDSGHFSICCGLNKQTVGQILKILSG